MASLETCVSKTKNFFLFKKKKKVDKLRYANIKRAVLSRGTKGQTLMRSMGGSRKRAERNVWRNGMCASALNPCDSRKVELTPITADL